MRQWNYEILAATSPPQWRKLGSLVPGAWVHPDAPDQSRQVRGLLLVDTGAAGVVIDESLAVQLRLSHEGTTNVHGAHGSGELKTYLAKLLLPARDSAGSDVLFACPIVCTGTPQLLQRHQKLGAEVIGILGRLFLQFCSIEVDGMTGETRVRIDESVRYARP